MFESILVPIDGSEHSVKALRVAIDLAKKYGSTIYVLEVVDETIFYNAGVLPPLNAVKALEKKAKEDVDKALQEVHSAGIKGVGEALEGDPGTIILDYIQKNNISLVVMGSRGLSTFKRILLGSVSSRVVQESKIPVLIIK
ncbi:universal stress protein [Metallosphaera hakonensis]|uniref:Universal stress protein UspA n=1 Tax=Metallosphaera hakonensis JCM 8857 = DSM 7519 TaxID=1293036 RepID=A0A2U9IVS1_9CREN|nr:universal stress protein [Metallosphaera hakonensis]AWS00095.1 universal stress protein [Metallosphaera hakonensis JCM 8857 = DSM 7519]